MIITCLLVGAFTYFVYPYIEAGMYLLGRILWELGIGRS